MTPVQLALLALFAPLASAAITACFLRRRGNAAATLSIAAAAAVAFGAFALAFGGQRFESAIEWLRLGEFSIPFGFKYDDLAALMLCIVGTVGLCVHVFSLAYMGDDPAKGRYFGGLSIFMFSIVGIVLADNLFMMFIFWELVGFSSWLLIAHWYEREAPAAASKKAFIVNRVGDVGFLLGIVMCYWLNHTVSLSELDSMGASGTLVFSRIIPLLLFCGAVGKSAQLPLHVWLPDAMEGPTPVSALIHAATMVAAGIYMLCRVHALMVPEALVVIRWIGTLTAVYAALCAVVQSDIKKVLAYSTLSQLGYMVAAFGLGSLGGAAGPSGRVVASGVGAAMFHLTTHAYFKGLLFLAAGSIIHACHHEQDIFKMGGLRKKMPFTFLVFTIGVAAISGLPFLAGFFSKDAILFLAFRNDPAVFAVLAFTAALTALYMTRMWKIVFFGSARSDGARHAHENGAVMGAPLAILATLSVVGGYLALYPRSFGGVLDLVPEAGTARGFMIAISLTVLTVGAGLGWLGYACAGTDSLEARAPGFFGGLIFLNESFDLFYTWYVEKVQQRFAMVLNFIEVIGLAGLVVRGAAGLVGMIGLGARALHSGRINAYVYWFLAGVAVLWLLAARGF
jgi:NADH-quinone oxidoreductase subunit L